MSALRARGWSLHLVDGLLKGVPTAPICSSVFLRQAGRLWTRIVERGARHADSTSISDGGEDECDAAGNQGSSRGQTNECVES